jgi:hypothetical protein
VLLPIVPVEEWFQQGCRVLYDPAESIILKETPTSLYVWEHVIASFEQEACAVKLLIDG